MPSPIYATTAAEMREIDRLSIEDHGTPGIDLMQRAGEVVVDATLAHFERASMKAGVAVVAGKGNNGGDALVVARLLAAKRIPVRVFLACDPKDYQGDALHHWKRLRRTRVPVVSLREGLAPLSEACATAGLIVDGIYGTGLRGPAHGLGREVLQLLTGAPPPIVAIDLPSGLDADLGVANDPTLRASLTVTLAYPKIGMLQSAAIPYVGEIVVGEIGIADEAVARVAPKGRAIAGHELPALLPPRDPNGHKGSYGHVAILAGAAGTSGAARLAARAALRAGAGLATLASPAAALAAAPDSTPEVMTSPLPGRNGQWSFSAAALRRAIDGRDAVVFGPGVGIGAGAMRSLEWLLAECEVPLLVDADGLNLLATRTSRRKARAPSLVLTPHPGEMSRLLRRPTTEVQADRVGAARALALRFRAVVVLKGARSLVVSPGGEVGICLAGNPGMASGGMGDALSGIIGALLAQGLDPEEAASAGVQWHAEAGDRVAAARGEDGMLASDLIEELPPTLRDARAALYGT